jgi:hypothetical protein
MRLRAVSFKEPKLGICTHTPTTATSHFIAITLSAFMWEKDGPMMLCAIIVFD